MLNPEANNQVVILPDCELRELSSIPAESDPQGWREYLSSLSVISICEGALLLVDEDVAYVVFPNGLIYKTSLPYGVSTMSSIRVNGVWNTIHSAIRLGHQTFDRCHGPIRHRICESLCGVS